MYILFDEAGKFIAGRILSEADASLQAELDSGKRTKVKSANALLRFEKPAPAEFLAAAQALAESIELELAWEFAPEGDDFGFAELAREYFSSSASASASPVEQAAMLLRLQDSPHYFRRAGKGRFKKAAPEIVQQALAAIEKKKAQAAQISAWAAELGLGNCPEPVRQQIYKILFKPDKNTAEYKAVVEAARNTQTPPLVLLLQAGAIASPYQFHWQRFLFENFPKGTAFPALPDAPEIASDALSLAVGVAAFSIDDSSTTEIDDALSVRGLGTGTVTLGIHIAAPGLAVQPGSSFDSVARTRLSTVYMPGYKLTMLPDTVVQHYTLQAGRNCPALSLYVTLDESTLAITSTSTQIEQVFIAANLRHDVLDSTFTEAFFAESASLETAAPEWSVEMRFLHRLALHLKAGREVVRGKPENFNRPDYNFKLDNTDGGEPQGEETVFISTRQRGAPLDLIVAEAMILANSTWGQWLDSFGVPAIYRSQASMAPGVKVRMGTRALPHAGMGVASYAWCTSPLRRYTDLVNQWQLIACVKHGSAAALAAPFKPRETDLFAIISAFDAAYSAYNQFQNGIERYWTLKYVQQHGMTEIIATAFKDDLVRADDLPLVLPAMGAFGLPRNARVRVKLGEIDLIDLFVPGSVVERLDTAQTDADPGEAENFDDSEAESVPLAPPIAFDMGADPALDGPASDAQAEGQPG